MSKTIIYIVLLAILGYGVYYFIFSNKNAFASDEAGFTTTDTAALGKIYIADKNGNEVLLERKNNGWVLDGTYPAIQGHINTLLGTLATQIPLYPVPETAHDNVIKTLSANAIKVELYDKDGDKIKVFYVGGQAGTGGTEGTYMLMEHASRPYVVQVPGQQGYLTPRYATEKKIWRSRTVCDIKPEDLKSVRIEYPSEPLNSYTFIKNGDTSIRVLADKDLMALPMNIRRAKVYSKFFEDVNSELYLNGDKGNDTLLNNLPKRCIVDIESTKGFKQHIEIYWMPLNRRSKNLSASYDPGVPDGYDGDKCYATINNFKDTVMIQRLTFEKLLRKAYEFYQPDAEMPNRPDTIFNSISINNN